MHETFQVREAQRLHQERIVRAAQGRRERLQQRRRTAERRLRERVIEAHRLGITLDEVGETARCLLRR